MTHTAKHTPGPWVTDNYFDITSLRGDVIARPPLSTLEKARMHPRERQANAHLIAAAPAMYEALTHALSVCEAEAELRGENDIDDYLGGAAGPVARMIRAALAQAEGR